MCVCVCVCLCLSVSLKGSTESKRPRFWEALKAFALHTSVPDLEQQQKPRKHHRHPNNLVKVTTNTKTSHASKGYVCRIVLLNLLLRFSAAKSSPFGVSRFRKVTVHLSGRSLQQREISFLSNPQVHQVPTKQQQQPHALSSSLPPLIMRLHKFRSDN